MKANRIILDDAAHIDTARRNSLIYLKHELSDDVDEIKNSCMTLANAFERIP